MILSGEISLIHHLRGSELERGQMLIVIEGTLGSPLASKLERRGPWEDSQKDLQAQVV